MKLKRMITLALIICTTAATSTFAQGYVLPSRELVQALLNDLEECKEKLAKAEEALAIIKMKPSEYSVYTYLWAEGIVNETKKCIESKRDELDALRKKFPAWFNSPSAFLDINLRHPKFRSPASVEEMLEDLERKIAKVLDDFKKMKKPGD